MNRRSFFVFAAVFTMILMVFSFALAAGSSDVAYAVKVTNGDNVSVNLEASESLSTKVKGQYINISGDHCFKFTIFEPLEDSDWKVENGEKYLQFKAYVNTPAEYSITQYQYSWLKNNNDWSNDPVRSLIGTNDVRYEQISSGFRVNLEDLKNGEMRQDLEFKWLDEQGKEIDGVEPTQFRVEVALPVAIDAGRISCSKGGSAYDGLARYPVNSNGNSAATSIAKPFADINNYYYSLDGGTTMEAVPDNGVTFTDTADTSHTISWYVGSELVSTEYFKVAFREEAQFSYIDHDLFADTTKAGILEIKPTIQDGYTDDDGITHIDDGITHIIYDIDFSKIDCQRLLCEFGDGETLAVPFEIKIPDNAVGMNGLGCGWDLGWDETHDLLEAEDYYSYGKDEIHKHNVKMANVIVDGSSTVITPIPGNRGQIVKWMDNEGNEHYHRITIHLRFASHDSYRVETVTPSAGRLTLNCNNYPNVGSPVYENGVVRYSVNGVDGNSDRIRTRIKSPSGEFKGVKVIPQGNTEWYWDDLSDGHCEISSFVSEDNVSSEVYKLEWERIGEGIYKEMITVAVEPAHSGIWLDDTWAAIPEGRIYLEHADVLENHIKYDEASGCWTFAINGSKDPMLDHIAFDTTRFMVKPPEGATHYKVAMWGAPLYSDNLGVTTQNQLNMKEPIPIEDDRDSLIWYDGDRNALYFDHGVTLIKTALADAEGMTIYTVNSTRAGNADSVFFEWYAPDANGVLQRMTFGEKTGEYSYLIKKPYINTKLTDLRLKGSEVTEGVVNATAIVYKCPEDVSLEDLELRCEIPLQKDTHGNKRYSYMKLDLVDEYGNVYKLPPNTEIKVILPYPEGLNKDNTKLEHFDVWHYKDESHSKHESMRKNGSLALEDIGITFITDSFSPFLLSYEPVSGSSGGSYTGSSKPSIAYPSAPQQVEVAPGASASMSVRASNASAYQWYIDRNDGRGFVPISGANSSGYTTSPVEAKHSGYRYFCRISNGYGSVDSAIFTLNVGGMNIPKTGDISILMPVLALIGAAAARCRRSSK